MAVRRYLVLLNTRNGAEFDRLFDYFRYSTVNYAMIDSEACLIDSYSGPNDIANDFNTYTPGAIYFICEITGEITWRNAQCGYNALNNFLNR